MIYLLQMLFFVFLVLLISRSAAADFQPVNLSVSDDLNIERKDETARMGIPFAQGRLMPDAALRVSGDRPLPTQTECLNTWPDGSVRWLLLQFPAACPASGTSGYTLQPGAPPAPEEPVAVTEQEGVVLMNSGALEAAFGTGQPLLGGFSTAGKADRALQPPLMELEEADGTLHSSNGAEAELIEIEEHGPVTAAVRVGGWLQGPADEREYRLDTVYRLHAGSSAVEMHTTIECRGEPSVRDVKRITLSMPLDHGVAECLSSGMSGWQAPDADSAWVAVDTEMQWHGAASEGSDGAAWALARNSARTAGMAVRRFEHLNPKSLNVSDKGLRLDLWTDRFGDILPFGRGRTRTHSVLLDFAPDPADPAAKLKAWEQPLLPMPSAAYMCETGALGPLSPAGADATKVYDEKVHEGFLHQLRERENAYENGFQHFGDYYHGGYGNEKTRGNLEYDTAHCAFLGFMRTADRRYYDFAVDSNQHLADMDVNHVTGEQLFHGYRDKAEVHAEILTHQDWGHIYIDGLADAWLMTGDRRSLRILQGIADHAVSVADSPEHIRNIFAGAERNLGWPLAALCRAYELTGNPRYLDASRAVVEYIKVYARNPLAQYRDGRWWRCWMMDGCKPFMVGQLHDGLSAYHRVTGDDELAKAITKSLDWLIDHMWDPDGDGFMYEFNAMNRGHRIACHNSLNMLIVDAFRVGYEITGDERYLSVAVRAFNSRLEQMDLAPDGKQWALDARRSPHTAAYLQQAGVNESQLPPSPKPLAQEKAPGAGGARDEVLLRAEFDGNLESRLKPGDMNGMTVGSVEYVEGRDGQALQVGQSGYAWLPAPPEMLQAPGTLMLWVRPHFEVEPLGPNQRAMLHVEGATPLIDSLGIVTIYGELRVRMKDHVGHLNGTAEGNIEHWKAGEWHHIAVAWDQTRVRLYLDGVEQTRDDEGERPGDGIRLLPSGGQSRINLGWRFGNWYCDCDLDSLTVYGRALEANEIAMMANEGAAEAEPGRRATD